MKDINLSISLNLIGLIILLGACSNKKLRSSASQELPSYVDSPTGLQYRVLKVGNGDEAKIGDEVLLYETTSYRNGEILYSNEGSGQAIKVKLGANQVTKGVEEGLRGMRAGEVRELIVPNYLAKRTIYPENVSPDSTLLIKLIVSEVISAN